MHQHVLNQAEVVVLEPDLAKIVRHFQSDLVTRQRIGPHRREPEVVNVGIKHGAQHFLRGGPYFFGRDGHGNFFPAGPGGGRFIHLAS